MANPIYLEITRTCKLHDYKEDSDNTRVEIWLTPSGNYWECVWGCKNEGVCPTTYYKRDKL